MAGRWGAGQACSACLGASLHLDAYHAAVHGLGHSSSSVHELRGCNHLSSVQCVNCILTVSTWMHAMCPGVCFCVPCWEIIHSCMYIHMLLQGDHALKALNLGSLCTLMARREARNLRALGAAMKGAAAAAGSPGATQVCEHGGVEDNVVSYTMWRIVWVIYTGLASPQRGGGHQGAHNAPNTPLMHVLLPRAHARAAPAGQRVGGHL